MPDERLVQELHDFRRKSREDYLTLMGVDVGKLRELEQGADRKFGALSDRVRESLKDAGGEVAERHRMSGQRTALIKAKVAEGVMPYPPEGMTALHCYCWPFNLAAAADHGNDPAIITPASGGTATASVTFGDTGCVAHPMVDARGQGTGTTNSAEITSWCRYSFMPSSDKLYCIKPEVYLNGHYLAWTWGTCSGAAEGLGTAAVRAIVTLQIDQLSLPVKTVNHTVVDVSGSGGSDTESGFAYDSTIDGGLSTNVLLQGGHEAVVWVKCRIFAEVTNHGRAWVDMQTSPQFYFRTDAVPWGRVHCFPFQVMPAQATPIPLP